MNFGIYVGIILAFTAIIVGHIAKKPSRRNAPNAIIVLSSLLTALAIYSTEIFQSKSLLNALWFYKIPYVINTLNIGLPYLYFHKIIIKDRSFNFKDFRVVIPSVLVAIYLIPFFQLNTEVKRRIYLQSIDVYGPNLSQYENPINEAFLILLIGIYIALIMTLVRQDLRKYLEQSALTNDIKQSVYFYNWIQYFWKTHVVFFILVAVHALSIFISSYFANDWSQLMTGSLILVGWISLFFYVALHPKILDLLPEEHNYLSTPAASNITSDLLAISERLKSEQHYLKPGLTLFELALHCELSQPRVRAALKFKGTNFNEYINRLRVEHFIQTWTKERFKLYGIEGLAKKSGFNSKTTFYTSFKAVTNKTPREYFGV